MKAKVTITFDLDPEQYAPKPTDIVDLVKAMIAGEADWPECGPIITVQSPECSVQLESIRLTCQQKDEPIHQDPSNGLWYFWDETWMDRVGPYQTVEMCRSHLKYYAEGL